VGLETIAGRPAYGRGLADRSWATGRPSSVGVAQKPCGAGTRYGPEILKLPWGNGLSKTVMAAQVIVRFIRCGTRERRKAKCPPNLRYPNGTHIDLGTRPACLVSLPYPAPRCGWFLLDCPVCHENLLVTVSGQRDDPCSVMLPCRKSQ
jgi:hypothetical protein